MKTSQAWIEHFEGNSNIARIDWQIKPSITFAEKKKYFAFTKSLATG